jgi:rhodanese-related sulfurtransferase
MSKTKSRRQAARKTVALPRQTLLWIGLGAAALVILAVVLWPKGDGYPAEISVAEAAAKRDQGAFILDVRTPEEWNEFHIPGSTLIPLDQLEARVSEVPRDQEVVVVCRSGNRSQTGRDILRQAGFEKVTSMAGGVKTWSAEGLPTETGP